MAVALKGKVELDGIDCAILDELQEDSRISHAELGRRVHLTAPAVSARIQRLQDAGIIRGFRVELGLTELGLEVQAFVRVRADSPRRRAFLDAVTDRQEVLECHHVTGDDCCWVKVAARSMTHLDEVVEDLGRFGPTTTSIVFASQVLRRTIRQPEVSRRSRHSPI
jgi:Lrp/AsnC family leucine-responsive transcriptional regulator